MFFKNGEFRTLYHVKLRETLKKILTEFLRLSYAFLGLKTFNKTYNILQHFKTVFFVWVSNLAIFFLFLFALDAFSKK